MQACIHETQSLNSQSNRKKDTKSDIIQTFHHFLFPISRLFCIFAAISNVYNCILTNEPLLSVGC